MSGSRGVLLIVEDPSPETAQVRSGLTQAGYTVADAADAAAVLKGLAAHPVQAVIADVHGPNVDGLALLDLIKARAPQTRVILTGAPGNVESAVEAMRRGACDYVIKPLRADVLVQRLQALAPAQAPQAGPDDGNGWATSAPAGQVLGHVNSPAAESLLQRMDSVPEGLTETMAGVEKTLIDAALRRAAGNQAKAAQLLRIPRTTLRDKMAKYGMVGGAPRRELAP